MKTEFCIIHFPGDDALSFETRVPVIHELSVKAGAIAADETIDVLGKVDLASEMMRASNAYLAAIALHMEPSGRGAQVAALFDVQAAFLAGFVGRVQQLMMHAGIGVTKH